MEVICLQIDQSKNNDEIIKLISMNTIQSNTVNISIPLGISKVKDKSESDDEYNLSLEKNISISSK